MNKAKKDAIFMHCLPAKRDQEVTSDVIDGSQSVVWDELRKSFTCPKSIVSSPSWRLRFIIPISSFSSIDGIFEDIAKNT